ncbi:MAG: GNAT family N-acetyltransferase [bacterium]|nr:GNAT family N-acetyltransferase [bacterium]
MYTFTQQIDRQAWTSFVAGHPRGNIFHTHEFYDVLKATKFNEPVLTAVVDENNEPVGILMSVIQKEFSGILGVMTARSIIYGGPLVRDNDREIMDFLLKGYNKVIKRKAIYTQFRNMWDPLDEKELFEANGYVFEEHLNILVDISKTEEQLWKEVHFKGRNKVRRAAKEGTTFRELKTPEECALAYDILKDVYSRAKLPLHDKSMFDAAIKILLPKGMVRFFGAVNEDKVIGTIVMLCYGNRMFDWYAGSYGAYYKKNPNDILPWETFLWGREKGYTLFDFGGAGKPGVPYGVRDYKKKYGGEFVNHGRYEKVNKKFLMSLGKLGLECFKLLKGAKGKKGK